MIVLFVILGIYALLLLAFGFGFQNIKRPDKRQPFTFEKVSIIICAKNEAKHIRKCLETIMQQQYPKAYIEILFVDDGSSDETLEIARKILSASDVKHQILVNPKSIGKKQSLAIAIEKAENPFIITRDADTYTISTHWLTALMHCRANKKSDFIIAPVMLQNNDGLLWALQAVENNILQVLAGGSSYFKKPFLCSGANLGFSKSIYIQCQGYRSHLHVASGDDVLFLEDVKKIKEVRIHYLKSTDGIVVTHACKSLGDLIAQKVRWASKFKYNSNLLNTGLAFLTFSVNAVWIMALFKIWQATPWQLPLTAYMLIKLLIDFLILFVASNFIKNKNIAFYSIPALCLYPLYACVIALTSLLIKPRWK